jgi:hypothetical protein
MCWMTQHVNCFALKARLSSYLPLQFEVTSHPLSTCEYRVYLQIISGLKEGRIGVQYDTFYIGTYS